MMIIAAHLLGAFLNWAIQKKKDKEEPGEEKEDKNNEVTKKQKVILLWDSHMEALVLPELEKIAHFDLVAPGALRAKNITTMGGHSQRAYNSVFNWPGARFPRGCQEYRVAEMLSIGSYDILVLSLCCNDISNLTSTPTNLHLFFAETSGFNTLHIAENALCRFPKLKKVVILDAPPRIDSRSPRGPIVLPPVQWTRSLARKTRITYKLAHMTYHQNSSNQPDDPMGSTEPPRTPKDPPSTPFGPLNIPLDPIGPLISPELPYK